MSFHPKKINKGKQDTTRTKHAMWIRPEINEMENSRETSLRDGTNV